MLFYLLRNLWYTSNFKITIFEFWRHVIRSKNNVTYTQNGLEICVLSCLYSKT